MDIQTVRLTEMAQLVSRTASNPVSPLPNPGINGSVTHTPSADIKNFVYVTRKMHHRKSLTIAPIAVPLDVLQDRKGRCVATTIGSVITVHNIANCAFILNGNDAIQNKEREKLYEEERKKR